MHFLIYQLQCTNATLNYSHQTYKISNFLDFCSTFIHVSLNSKSNYIPKGNLRPLCTKLRHFGVGIDFRGGHLYRGFGCKSPRGSGCKSPVEPIFQGIHVHKSPRGYTYTNPLKIVISTLKKNNN